MDDRDAVALRRLLDKEAIRDASLAYTRGIDRHDDEIMARAYHADATDDHGAYIGDPAGFIRHAREGHGRNWTAHHHYITNQTIDLDGDTAHVETYFLAALRRGDGSIDLVGGRYVDRFERREGRWAVADRACLVEWNGELSPAQAAIDPDMFLKGRWDRQDISYQRPLRLDRPARDLAL
ncbi:nuclear transport factor 2 family protein [Sphingomonas profundi]|uniref:nuclear transport factor 2 family protein n=1 Tax=Alterirhizorhabdus profundi TaxID=2681549 RepID=UPI0012E7D759|nr:nuclear transport factor 2 family protein [Sphingomonas profundi]